jgi:hypothetical protein
MGWLWLQRAMENAEQTRVREAAEKKESLDELSKSDDFKQMVKDGAAELIEEQRRVKEERVLERKRNHESEMEKALEYVDTIGETMQDSTEPFCNVLSLGFDPELGIKVKLDYNPAFIRYLNAAGIKASNDEETVRLWLAHLNYDIQQENLAGDYFMNGVSEDEMPEGGYDDMFGMDEEGKPLDDDPAGMEPDEEWPRE